MPKPRPRVIPDPSPAPAHVPFWVVAIAPARFQFIAAVTIFASLLAAGACGLIGHPLRHATTLVALLAICAAAIPSGADSLRRIGTLALFALLGGYLSVSNSTIVSTLGVLVLVCGVTLVQPEALRTLRPVCVGVFVLALYRLAHDTIPTIWQASDVVGQWIGRAGATISGEALSLGATFAGLDALILMVAFASAILMQSERPRVRRTTFLLISILVVHAIYLYLLATLHFDPSLTPWNVPLCAAILHSILAVFILRWTKPSPQPIATSTSPAIAIGMAIIAVAFPIVSMLCWTPLSLNGKTIVFCKKGFLNWLKPEWGEYGRLSQGMYGLLATSSTNMEDGIGGTGSRFIDLYGGKAIVSPELSEEDLKQADALVMLYPDKAWKTGQVERVRKFVETGGTLLLFGEHTICDRKDDPDPRRPRWKGEAIARFNDLLRDTQMRVNFDSAVFAVGGWLQSYEALAHPVTLGVRDDRNEFGVVIGASLNVHWPAAPFIVGKYGIGDPGDEGRTEHAMLGNEQYDPGERLGDVVLAAEQNIGRGRIVLFGDTSMMSNGLLYGCHDFVARLLAYVGNRSNGPQAIERQLAGALLLAAMLVLLSFRPHPIRIAATALLLAASISICTEFSHRNATLIPEGRARSVQPGPQPNKLVYIDTSHMEASSLEAWRDRGTMGLALCWERSGYMTLTLPELSRERLDRAGVLISIAPARPFTDDEQDVIFDWVNRGGIFISTCGYDRSEASRELLARFGMYVGAKPGEPVPEPLGWFKSIYTDTGSYKPHVRFWAAWPLVWSPMEKQPDPQPIAYGGADQAVILKRNFGQGKVVLIGDTDFALNKNLEWENGQPFEGMHENSDFWRWFIDVLREAPEPWKPTDPTTKPSEVSQ